MRKNHKLVTAKKLTYPNAIICLDTETTTLRSWESVHRPELICGSGEYISLDKELNIRYVESFRFRNKSDVWRWIMNIVRYNQEVFIYAHNWSFDFPTLDGLGVLESEGFELQSIVDGCPPTILKWGKENYRIWFIDSMNYFRSSLAEMGKVIGLEKGSVEFDGKYSKKLADYCDIDVRILRESMIGLMRFLRENDLTRMTHTISSLALSTYVRKFNNTTILIDGNETRSKIARASYFGGRTEAFKLGEYTGEFYMIDVNSQYPYIMANNRFPYRTQQRYKNVGIKDLIDVMGRYSVVAEVTINTNTPAYPYKINNRTCFPVGCFKTVLSTPEIYYALEKGHIIDVDSIIVYDDSFLFKDYVNHFYNGRLKFKKAGNDVWASLSKYLLNTLYGKFGQQHHEWELSPIEPRGHPHTRHELDAETGQLIYLMEINNQVFVSVTHTEARDSFPAIAAHVTAGGRMMIQRMIDKIGLDHVYYCDTDSLLLDKAGYDKISADCDEDELGRWSLDNVFSYINIRGCKDYVFDEKEKAKGIRKNAREVRPGVYEQLQFATLRGLVRSGHAGHASISKITKTLTRKYEKGNVVNQGIVEPFMLTLD